jgi:hypothetical protein
MNAIVSILAFSVILAAGSGWFMDPVQRVAMTVELDGSPLAVYARVSDPQQPWRTDLREAHGHDSRSPSKSPYRRRGCDRSAAYSSDRRRRCSATSPIFVGPPTLHVSVDHAQPIVKDRRRQAHLITDVPPPHRRRAHVRHRSWSARGRVWRARRYATIRCSVMGRPMMWAICSAVRRCSAQAFCRRRSSSATELVAVR